MRRWLVLTGPLLVLAVAAPAWAHEEINPSSVPTGQPVFFTLNAANEKTVDLNKVTLTAPEGLNFGATTKDPTGWTVNRTDTVITWTGGAVKPDKFEQWGFEIEGADQPGTETYKVTLGYADGTSDNVSVPITVHAASSAEGTSTSSSKSSSGTANAALVVGIVALLGAVAALVAALRRGSGKPAGSGEDAPVAAGGSQDW
jgi:hypothetical protein